MLKTEAEITKDLQRRLRRVRRCTVCGGEGIVPSERARNVVASCSCRRSALLEHAKWASGIPDAYTGFTFADLDAYEPDVRDILKKFVVAHQKVWQRGLSLFLCGVNGTGKTVAACTLLTEHMNRGFHGYYMTMAEFLDLVFAGYKDEEAKYRFRDAVYADTLLVLDEVGVEQRGATASDIAVSEFDSVIRWRYANRKPTILVSNMTLSKLTDLYGGAIGSMLSGRYKTLVFTGENRRAEHVNDWEDLE